MAGGRGLPRWRLTAVLGIVALAAIVLTGKLFYLQVLQNSFLGGKAQDAHRFVRELDPPRGTITDRNGVTLAANRTVYRLTAAPSIIPEDDVADIAAALAPIVKLPARELEKDLAGDSQWVSLATRLTPEQADQVRAKVRELNLESIGLEPSPARVYPNGSLASHVLGFANHENQGSYGVEEEYEGLLQGEPGKMAAEQDPGGNWLAIARQQVIPPEDGADVQLTIDGTIQYFAESELRRTVLEQKAKGGTIIVMRPKTGEILAMASYPSYKPEEFDRVRNAGVFVNPAVSQLYEPGSTFKIITMATGLAEGVITPDTRINDRGLINVDGQVLHNWDYRPHPNESMTEVLMNSANVGAAYVSTKVGKDAYYRRLRQFGFGAPTGIDLPGETSGMLILPSDPRWSPINLYTNGYGQGIGVTPIQLITAEAAVANGGLLMRPYVVSKVVRDGKVVRENKPTVVRRVLEPEVANTLKGMMQTVVEEGEYQVARITGYTIGGKTGTSSIPKNGGFSKYTIASFVGYSYVKDPQFIVLVKIDEPKKSRWGSEVAAPAFKNLARRLYVYLNMAPDKPTLRDETRVP
jgi:cell division protein FtsI/penicillin-binding protein 2